MTNWKAAFAMLLVVGDLSGTHFCAHSMVGNTFLSAGIAAPIRWNTFPHSIIILLAIMIALTSGVNKTFAIFFGEHTFDLG